MGQWIVITKTDLDSYLVADQAEAIRTAALAEGQADRFTDVMPAIAARIRAQVQAKSQQVDTTPNSVPFSLKTAACLLIIEAMQAGIPGLSLTEDQKRMLSDARDLLKSIAAGELFVEKPDSAAPTQTQQGGTRPCITPKTNLFGDQDGL